MSKLIWNLSVASATLLATYLLTPANAQASPISPDEMSAQLDSYEAELSEPMAQVTSVSELRDVQPTEWAYEALRSLVERYGCIVGYPDRTYRGDRALSRWEFAAGLNACMNVMERLIQENVSILKEDVDTLKRLMQEFEAELAALGARVDNLEGRVSFLEDHQFSTTTQLTGEVVFGLYGVASGEKFGGEEIDRVPAFGQRTRLELNTSFTGEDLLFTRLATGNIAELSEQTGTFQSELAFAQPDGNDVAVEVLLYSFPLTENVSVWIEAAGGAADDFTSTFNFLDGDGGTGALSAFGTRNPIYLPMDGSGVGVQAQLGNFELSAGYLASEASDPSEGNGLFNGPYSAIAQIGYLPSDDFGIALTYLHGYNNLDTGTGSSLSNFQSFTEDLFGEAVPVSSNSYGIQFSWQVSEKFVLGGWGGYTNANTLSTLGGQIDRGSLDIWNWAVTLAFPDAFKEGSTAGIIVGMQPWVSDSSIDGIAEDDDTSLHLEAFYEYAVTDNIKITPGVIVITSPDYNDDNSTLVIGTIRTTFTF